MKSLPPSVLSFTENFASHLDSFISGELQLPYPETELVQKCPVCKKQDLLITSPDIIIKMRQKITKKIKEREALHCISCCKEFSATSCLESAIESGYKRLNLQKPTENEIKNMRFQGLRPEPEETNKLEHHRWLLDLASIQMRVNIHDWKHRASCFKSKRPACRYKISFFPSKKTSMNPVFKAYEADNLPTNQDLIQDADHNEIRVQEMELSIKKREPFIFLTDCNRPTMSVINSNNCCKYVEDQKVSLYYCNYTTKHTQEPQQGLADSVKCVETFKQKQILQEKIHQQNFDEGLQVPTPKSDYVKGLAMLHSAIRGSTNGETIGAPLAGYCLRGNLLFRMSHQTVVLPLNQALFYLENKQISATVSQKGVIRATIYDKVYQNFHPSNLTT